MQDDEFEWDDGKAALNWRNHGVSFEIAREVFKDIFAIEWTDDRHGGSEERFVTSAWWKTGFSLLPTR